MVAIGEEEPMQEPGHGERILVSVRLRPLNEKETARNDVSDWECINDNTIIYRNNLSISERSMYPTAYTFDRVFSTDCSTRRVYEEGAKKVALSVASGINSSIFAYGQTSSGKTYTMSGITEYAVADLYDYIDKHEEREFVLKFSALEIYNESVRDLLSADTTPLRLLDDPERGTIVEKLTEETLRDWNHFRELLSVCEAQRQIGETSLNEASSRSHQILRLVIESSAREFLGYDKSSSLTAMVNFVDLAGSERASQTLSAGTRLKEGCHINRSLLTLGTVIRKLSKGRNGHIPYRDSKLTRILQSSLGGNARTAIICTLSPAHSHVEQSRNTLLFASCAKEVTTNAQVNVVMSDKTLVKHLQKQLAKLENELKSSGSKIVPADSYTLLREKDLQIEKLKKEVSELTLQRDLAQSQVKDLVRVLEDDKPSPADLDRYYPKLRVRNSWENIEIQPSAIPVLAGSHHRRGSVRSFSTSQYSDVDSRTSSDDTLLQLPDFDDNFLIPHSFSSSQLPVRFPNSIDANLHQEENKEQSDVNSEDVCKEVRCIEMEESSTNRYVASNISDSSRSRYQNSNLSSPAANTPTSGLTVVENGDGTNKELQSPLLNHKGFVIQSPEKTSQWLPEEQMSTPLIYKLRRSRSCKASLVTTFSSCWLEMVEKNENTPLIEFEKSYNESTPPTEFEKNFVGRPKVLQKKLPSFKYDDSQASARTAAASDECKLQNTESTTNDESIETSSLGEETKETTTTDDKTIESSSLVEETNEVTTTNDKATESSSLVEGTKEMVDTQCITQLADSMETDTKPIPETGLRPNPSTRDVKDVGLDPMPMDEESDSMWPSEFKRLQREIVELWHACNVSLVHRTYFFLLFKGDPSDSIYMEVELRRLSFLKGTFLKGDQALEDGLTPAITGFALVGGPARQDHPRAIEALMKLDVPYIVALPLVFQTTEEWLNSTLGLHPIQVALQVALPELDGGMEPIVFAGRDPRTGKSHALHKRVEQLCTRAIRWGELKRKAKAEKKLAITVFSFPPDKGNVGTAAYLNVFSSIFSVLQELKRDGYNVENLPETSEALIEEVIHDKEAQFSSPNLNIAYKMGVREYQSLTPYAAALEENWGKPPGNLNSDGENLLVYGKQYGNVFIGVQPTFGYEGDPMRLLFSKSASPHHGFAAYYSFVEKIFQADAVLHFGTHGSLEFMPGKQVGMSDACFPDSLIGNIPNVYYYAANNPSEATIAKRRSYANTISYLTPPAENAGLYKGLKQLSELIASYQSLKDTGRGQQIVSSIISTARQCNLDKDVELPDEGVEISAKERDLVVGKVYNKIMEIESRLLPCGLHVIGEPPTAMEAVATLVNIAALNRPEENIFSLPAILAETVGRDIEDIYRQSDKGILKDVELLKQITDTSRGAVSSFVERTTNEKGQVVDVKNKLTSILGFGINEPWIQYLSNTKFYRADRDKLRTLFEYLAECLKLIVADNEIGSLKQALEGKFVEPGPGGDPIRNPKVLPTGKNIHALDPQSIPTTAAMNSAKIVVERLIERQKIDNGGKYPETIALVLWGTDNIKTYGESLAQVLWMVGVNPVADGLGRVNRVEVVSLEELGRPRIDVVVNCSGVFRDLFINQMNLLDRAVKMVAELDEPVEQNFVRKHALEQAETLGIGVREAATRIFSNASGSYSSNINLAVENSSWNDEKQLQDMYLSRKSFAFDCDAPGTGMAENRKVFEMALSTADATFQNLDSSEISLTDVSHYFDSDPTNLVQNLRKDGKKPSSYIADTTTANAQVRTLSETVRLDARTKLLNPKWYEGMLSSGYEGVREIEKRLTNTVGWSATSGQVDNFVYEEANSTFIKDEEMLNRLMKTNPNSFRKLLQTFLEANGRGYWDTDEQNIERLKELYSEVEDKIEGIDR